MSGKKRTKKGIDSLSKQIEIHKEKLKSCIPLVYLTSGGMQDVNNLCYYSDATSLLAGGDKDCFTITS